MGYYKAQVKVTKYRVRVEEYTEWVEQPDQDELQKPVAKGTSEAVRPAARPRAEWIMTDDLTSTSKSVLAGILRAKADELDPQDKTVYRGN